MKFFVVSLDFQNAPIDLRSKALIDDPTKLFAELEGVVEKVWLATCNRVEVYIFGSLLAQDLIDRWCALQDLDSSERNRFMIYEGDQAIQHIFRVCSSLESMVVGEAQILGQVKKAYDESLRWGWVGSQFNRLFQQAFRVAKRVRSQTEVGRYAVSIPSIGVKMAEKIVGSLTDKRVGILGLGEMGRISSEYFASVQPAQMLLYNRTKATADELAQELIGQKLQVEVATEPKEILLRSDVIVVAADVPFFSSEDLKQLNERGSLSFILDLTVPPQVPRLELDQVFVYGVDDLKTIADENNILRQQELSKAEEMILEEVVRFSKRLDPQHLSDTLQELSKKTDSLLESELVELRNRLSSVSETDWAEIEKTTRRVASKVLQDPVVELRSRAKNEDESESLIHFFRSIFRI